MEGILIFFEEELFIRSMKHKASNWEKFIISEFETKKKILISSCSANAGKNVKGWSMKTQWKTRKLNKPQNIWKTWLRQHPLQLLQALKLNFLEIAKILLIVV